MSNFPVVEGEFNGNGIVVSTWVPLKVCEGHACTARAEVTVMLHQSISSLRFVVS